MSLGIEFWSVLPAGSRYHAGMSKEFEVVEVVGVSLFKKLVLGAIGLIFVSSIICRVAWGSSNTERSQAVASSAQSQLPEGAMGFVEGGAPRVDGEVLPGEEETGALEDLLPIFTEASFFAMIGFALGYASRKVVKIGMILLAVFFALLQVLTYAEVTTIDWGRLVEILNDWILNLKENQSITDVLTDRVPTAGSLIAGYVLGFRKG